MLTQGAFQEDGAEFDFGGGSAARRRETAKERFRQTLSGLEHGWAFEQKRNPFYPFVTWTEAGPRLGAGALLVRKGEKDDARVLALISIACGETVPASALAYLVRAEIEFERGAFARSAVHVAMSGIPPLRGRDGARRLYYAAGILDAGFFSPARLMTVCGLDSSAVEAADWKKL